MNAHTAIYDQADKQAQPATVALFASDIHLSPTLPATTQAFLNFLTNEAAHTERLYLLGDIFEYWAGDDDANDPYHHSIISALRALADSGTQLFWIGGNRDFLVGKAFADEAGLTLLPDPTVIDVANQRLLLTHGDAACIDDKAYMAFRQQVRDPQWQTQFLSQPLDKRKQIVEAMRVGSKEAQRGKSMEIMDVNTQAITKLFANSGTRIMIHGHTHRPALHELEVDGQRCLRYVLPDWDCEEKPERGGWFAITEDGHLSRFDVRGAYLD